MTVIYDQFLPTGQIELPTTYPFTISTFHKDGSQGTMLVTDKHFVLHNVVAIKIHKPNLLKQLVAKAERGLHWTTAPHAEAVITWLDKEGLLKLDEPKQDNNGWLYHKMTDLGIHSPGLRLEILRWFTNPTKYPEVNADIGNAILTVMPAPNGCGKVVVCPNGHTLAYSMSKQLFDFINTGHDPQGQFMYKNHITVKAGELVNKNFRYPKVSVEIGNQYVKIGCQRIPMSAIKDLAKREGWTK